MSENVIENAAEKLSATQDKGKKEKTRKTAKEHGADYSPTGEHDPEERKASFRSEIASANGRDVCPLDVNPGYVLAYVKKDGITHRRMYSDKPIKAETAASGGFLPITYTSDGKSAIIDYDADKGRYYVKAFLAKVNNLKEIRLLKWTIAIIIVTWIFSVLLDIFQIYTASKIGESCAKAVSVSAQSAKPVEVADMRRTIQAPDPTPAIEQDPISTDAAPLENRNPGRLIR